MDAYYIPLGFILLHLKSPIQTKHKNHSSNSATQESRFDDTGLDLEAIEVTNIAKTYSKDIVQLA